MDRESPSDPTQWSVILSAADGDRSALDEFARRYAPMARAYLAARWRSPGEKNDVEDAVQEVLLDCVREGGALGRAEPGRPGGFRAFYYGIVWRVARKMEKARSRRAPGRDEAGGLDARESDETNLSTLFDREYARELLRQAHERHAARAVLAATADGDAGRRVELLRLRFEEQLPIRSIATLWKFDAVRVHRMYARARREFRAALGEVVGLHENTSPELLERECDRLLEMLA